MAEIVRVGADDSVADQWCRCRPVRSCRWQLRGNHRSPAHRPPEGCRRRQSQ